MNTYKLKGYNRDLRNRRYDWECTVKARSVEQARKKATIGMSCGITPAYQKITSCVLIKQQPEKQMKSEQLKQKIRDAQVSLEVLQGELQEALEAEKKWELPGGPFRVTTTNGIRTVQDAIVSGEEPFRASTRLKAKNLAQHLKNSAILWQLANNLNPDGWVYNWEAYGEYAPAAYGVYYCSLSKKWRSHVLCHSNFGTPVFKNHLIAQRAVEILNNQAKELRVKV